MSKTLRFYDVKSRKGFTTTKYAPRMKGSRHFVVATAPSGVAAWRIAPKK
jgi:hypothetical protein